MISRVARRLTRRVVAVYSCLLHVGRFFPALLFSVGVKDGERARERVCPFVVDLSSSWVDVRLPGAVYLFR